VLGPEKWGILSETCSGKYQSPIDIEEHLVTRVYWKPLKFTGIHELPYTSTLTNNGHTVMLELNTDIPVMVSGGPLRGNYTFRQLHFHWGINDSAGSEDKINHHSYSMELHMVFFKTAYKSMDEAMKHKDGLSVLALFFEISDNDNRVYAELVDSLEKIIYPDTKVELPYQLPLEFLLPADKVHFFAYNGSLTTPPCSEVVTWVEFKHPVLLSHRQLEKFRTLRSHVGLLTHNTRPVQPLHGRPVFYNVGESRESSAFTIQPHLLTWTLMFLNFVYTACHRIS
ncbi:hypothetical protein AAG570_010247, partial [Ranatra chinensis]